MTDKPKQPYDENHTYMDDILGVPNPKDHEDKPERPGHNPGDYPTSAYREELPE